MAEKFTHFSFPSFSGGNRQQSHSKISCDHFTHVFQFVGEKALNQALHLVLCINKKCSLEKSDHQLLEDIPKVTQSTSNLQQGNLLSLKNFNVICI
jgi:hypothetical protein